MWGDQHNDHHSAFFLWYFMEVILATLTMWAWFPVVLLVW